MNICVYGASSNSIEKVYISEGEHLGKEIALNNFGLVFGGGANGMMGAVARGCHSIGTEIIGVAPDFFNVDGVLFQGCTKFIYPDNMRERKRIMEDMSDGFIVTPGGIGTYDEFFEILTLKQLCRHNKPIALLNTNKYFDDLIKFLQVAIDKNFMSKESLSLFFISDNVDEIIDYIKQYKPQVHNISDFKKIK